MGEVLILVGIIAGVIIAKLLQPKKIKAKVQKPKEDNVVEFLRAVEAIQRRNEQWETKRKHTRQKISKSLGK